MNRSVKGQGTEIIFKIKTLKILAIGEFQECSVVKNPSFHCREPRFNPWLVNQDPTSHEACLPSTAKKKILSIEDGGKFLCIFHISGSQAGVIFFPS